jgi:hypothetical protein
MADGTIAQTNDGGLSGEARTKLLLECDYAIDKEHPLSGHTARGPHEIAVMALAALNDATATLAAISRLAKESDSVIADLALETLQRLESEHNEFDCDQECYEDAVLAAKAKGQPAPTLSLTC